MYKDNESPSCPSHLSLEVILFLNAIARGILPKLRLSRSRDIDGFGKWYGLDSSGFDIRLQHRFFDVDTGLTQSLIAVVLYLSQPVGRFFDSAFKLLILFDQLRDHVRSHSSFFLVDPAKLNIAFAFAFAFTSKHFWLDS